MDFDFEKAITEIEAITKKLGSGEAKLSEVMADYNKAKKLIAQCRKYLEQARKEIDEAQSADSKQADSKPTDSSPAD